jgi:putative SOS response-associated peptidase YedK
VVVASGELKVMRWGLVPFWAKDESIGNRMINARSETAREKPAFKNLLSRRRCLVLADGFYEWKKLGPKGKQPYYFRLQSKEPFAFAGLWDQWRPSTGDPLQTFTILTTQANDCVSPIHDRMPVILLSEAVSSWTEPEEQDPSRLQELLQPLPANQMECYPVGSLVNSPRNDSPLCIQPAADTSESGEIQPKLF